MCVCRQCHRGALNPSRGRHGSISRQGACAKLFAATFFSWEGEPAVIKSGGQINDNFMAMVTAKAEVMLPLSEFQPQSPLGTAEHHVERARFPVIDYHNHLDALDPVEVLRIMDACGIERIVNITMKTGDEAIAIIHKFKAADAERFPPT